MLDPYELYSYEALAKWLEENCPQDLVLSEAKGVTVANFVAVLERLADMAWSDGIDSRGEDA